MGIVSEATKLRDDIVMWSDNYAAKIEGMVKRGDFKFDGRISSPTTTRFDEKPDFRHWVDSVDIQEVRRRCL